VPVTKAHSRLESGSGSPLFVLYPNPSCRLERCPRGCHNGGCRRRGSVMATPSKGNTDITVRANNGRREEQESVGCLSRRSWARILKCIEPWNVACASPSARMSLKLPGHQGDARGGLTARFRDQTWLRLSGCSCRWLAPRIVPQTSSHDPCQEDVHTQCPLKQRSWSCPARQSHPKRKRDLASKCGQYKQDRSIILLERGVCMFRLC
jgi:hypothetical protein